MSTSRLWPKPGNCPLQAGKECSRTRSRRRGALRPPARRGSLALGAGHVAAGDDRREQEHRRDRRSPAQRRGPLGIGALARLLGRVAGAGREQPEQQHRQPEVGGDERLVRGRARPSVRRGPPGRAPARRRRPSRGPASGASRSCRRARQTSSAISTATIVGSEPVAELDHGVGSRNGQHAALAQRPALGAAAGRAAAEPGVADPDHAADHDQDEGGDDGQR